MPPTHNSTDAHERFIDYLNFVSDMLGGDILPLDAQCKDMLHLVSQRAIDYELMRKIVAEIQKHNAVFQQHELIEAFPTLDALGIIRGDLIQNKGDIHQISLLDRIGELTVSFFNLTIKPPAKNKAQQSAQIHSLK